MRNFKILSLIVACVFMMQSCSEDENLELMESATVESIRLFGTNSFAPGSHIKFKVVNNLGDVVTAKATIFVDGIAVNDHTYKTPTTIGAKFKVHAEFGGVKSNVVEGVIYTFAMGSCG